MFERGGPMRTRSTFAVLAALGAMAAGPVAAGDDSADSGTRIRLIRKGGQPPVVGRLVLRSPERLTVRTDGGRGMGVLFDQVARVQVSDGRDRAKWTALGGLFGLVAAGAVYAFDDGDCSGGGCAKRFGLMAAPGLVLGGVVGSRVAPERWRDVDRVPDVASLDRSHRFRLALGSTSGGARVTAALSF
jgi:hypothetical protein